MRRLISVKALSSPPGPSNFVPRIKFLPIISAFRGVSFSGRKAKTKKIRFSCRSRKSEGGDNENFSSGKIFRKDSAPSAARKSLRFLEPALFYFLDRFGRTPNSILEQMKQSPIQLHYEHAVKTKKVGGRRFRSCKKYFSVLKNSTLNFNYLYCFELQSL